MSDESARKYDNGKAEYSLIPPAALKEIALVFTHGRTKYGPNNWLLEEGLEWTRVYDAAIRHIQAWASGDDTDSESHLPHLAHAAVNIIFLLEYWKRGAGIDNRYFANQMPNFDFERLDEKHKEHENRLLKYTTNDTGRKNRWQ